MHHKFAVLNQGKDDTAAIFTGSFNWNTRAATLNYENIVYIKSAKVAAAYRREYERIAGRGKGNDENMVAIRSPAMAASFIEHWDEMVSAVR